MRHEKSPTQKIKVGDYNRAQWLDKTTNFLFVLKLPPLGDVARRG